MKTIMKIVIGVIVFVLIADFVGFLAWVYSGQQPTGDFWLGKGFYEFLKVVLNIQ